MPTINSKKIIDEIIAGDGYYPGDDVRVVKIVQYRNAFDGGLCYGVIYEGHPLDMYAETEFVRSPETIWEAK